MLVVNDQPPKHFCGSLGFLFLLQPSSPANIIRLENYIMDKYKLLIIILDPVLFTGCVILQQQQKKKSLFPPPVRPHLRE